MLVDRINCESATSGLRLTTCVCELLVSFDPIEATDLDDEDAEYSAVGLYSIRDTELAMSKLKNLKRIYCGSGWSIVLPQTLREVQIHTKVQSVDLQVELFRLDQASAEKIFTLEGLKKFYLRLSLSSGSADEQETADEDTNRFKLLDLPSLLLEMLRASPDLEELGFDFEADRGSVSPDDRRNPSNIFTALADHIFPRLRVFAVTHLWLYEESPGLRRFLFHHPNLLSVDLCLNMDAEDSFDTEDIETVFPSVLKFRGPYKICRALTCSPVAQQLESFTIYKTYHLRHVRLPELPHPYGRSSPLPRLRNLEVIHSPVQIHDLVEMTPNVEKIRLSITSAVYFENTVPSVSMSVVQAASTKLPRVAQKDFLKLLHQTPNLRVIELYRSYSGRMKKKLTADSVRWFIRQVATICPKLFRIDDLERDSIGYWDITHNHDGNVSFHYHFDPRFDLFPGLEFPRTPITSGLGSHPWNRHDEWYGSLGSVNGVV